MTPLDHPIMQHIQAAIAQKPKTCREMCQELGLSRSMLDRHLFVLMHAGLVVRAGWADVACRSNKRIFKSELYRSVSK